MRVIDFRINVMADLLQCVITYHLFLLVNNDDQNLMVDFGYGPHVLVPARNLVSIAVALYQSRA